jgi:hypothetical protein
LSLCFYNHSPSCLRDRLHRRCALGPPAPAPPRGPPSMFLSVDGGRSRTSSSGTSRGPAVDVFNFGGDRCWTCHQRPPGGAAVDVSQLRWWPLRDTPPAPPRGAIVDVFNFGATHCRTYHEHPPGGPPSMSSTLVVVATGHAASTSQGIRHRHFQLWW